MDNGNLLTPAKTPGLPPPSTGVMRQSVQLPRNWAEMIERWGEGNIRDVVMKAIETHVLVYANQVREETIEGRKIPILTRSPTGNSLIELAQTREISPASLVRVGASLMVKLLTETVDNETIYDAISKRADKSGRAFAEEIASILREKLNRRG
jgi:hypothetical protein